MKKNNSAPTPPPVEKGASKKIDDFVINLFVNNPL